MTDQNLPYGDSKDVPEINDLNENNEDENRVYSKQELLTDPNLKSLAIKKQIFLTREMKDLFLDCALTGKPYKQTFEVIPGKMKVIMRSMSAKEMDKITHTFDDISPKTSLYAISGSVQRENLVYGIDKVIVLKDKDESNETISFENYDKKRDYVGNLSLSIYERLIRLNQIFQIYLVCLQEEMFSSDF